MNGNCTVVDVRDNVCTAPVNTCDITGIHQSISLTISHKQDIHDNKTMGLRNSCQRRHKYSTESCFQKILSNTYMYNQKVYFEA